MLFGPILKGNARFHIEFEPFCVGIKFAVTGYGLGKFPKKIAFSNQIETRFDARTNFQIITLSLARRDHFPEPQPNRLPRKRPIGKQMLGRLIGACSTPPKRIIYHVHSVDDRKLFTLLSIILRTLFIFI